MVPEKKIIIIRGNLNGHIGKDSKVSARVNGGWGFGERNEAEEDIVVFSETYGLDIVNMFFKRGMSIL